MLKLATEEAVGRDPVGIEAAEIVAGADHDRLGLDRAAACLEPWWCGTAAWTAALTQDGHAVPLLEIGGEPRDGVARFDPDLMRRMERGRQTPLPSGPHRSRQELGWLDHAAVLTHLGRAGTPPARPWPQAGVQSVSSPCWSTAMPAFGGDLGPDIARSHGATPTRAGLLARDRDETEIADRGAVSLGVAVEHHDALATTCRG